MDGKKKHVTAAEKTIPAAVHEASKWALFNALGKPSFVRQLVEWTDAEAAEASALWLGMLCCAVLQAATAALALQLPCRRRWVRRALAYLALALTFVGHCTYAVHVRLLLAADPGYLFRISATMDIVVSVVDLVVDLLWFLDLLLLGGEDLLLCYCMND